MYHVVLAFGDQAHLDAWHDSPERAQGLQAAAPFIVDPSSIRPMVGLGLLYRTAPAGLRWKVAVVTWLGICPTVYLLFLLTSNLMKSWALLPRTIVLTVAVVAVMSWIVAPQLTKLLRRWLLPNRQRR